MKKVVFLLLLPLEIFFSSHTGWAGYTQLDDRQPAIMLWPEANSMTQRQFRFHSEKAAIKEKVRSNFYEEMIEKPELGTYSFDFGYRYNDELFAGVQFGETRIPLLNLALSFNAQYDFYKQKHYKLAVGAMYGGVLFPAERYGVSLLASYFWQNFQFFYSHQFIRSKRYFHSAVKTDGTYFIDNALNYNLNSNLDLIGVEVNPESYWKRLASTRFALMLGFESSQVISTYNEKIYPANYHRGDGFYMGFDFTYYYKDPKVTQL